MTYRSAQRRSSLTRSFARVVTLMAAIGGAGPGCTSVPGPMFADAMDGSPTVSGFVRDGSGTGISGVVVAASGSVSRTVITAGDGSYRILVPRDWSGVVTPQHIKYDFEPCNRTYSDISVELDRQDFQATPRAESDANACDPADDRPTALFQSVVTREDSPIEITLTGNSQNNAALTFTIVTPPSHGDLEDPSASGGDSARTTYTPARNYHGMDAFEFKVSDGSATSDVVTVSIRVDPLENDPIAAAQSVFVEPNTPKGITLTGSNSGRGALTFSIVSLPAHGTLSGQPPNVYYQPDAGYQGSDAFVFAASDDSGLPVATAAVRIEVVSWTPPIGIPIPPFGIQETVGSVYGSAGYFTHYVDNTHPSATDSDNPNGTPTRPRRSVPSDLPAGSVVQVHGGVYNGDTRFSGQGTAERPIFIVGVNRPRFEGGAEVTSKSNSRYMILDGLHLACQIFISPPSHHICIRNSRIGPTGATGVAVGYGSGCATHLVIYNNTIAECGAQGQSYAWNQNPGADVDAHGIKIDSNARDCWVVDNVAYHNYGNFIQLSNANYPHDTVTRTYIGRNHVYENRQSAIGIKRTTDTFVSQNLIHGHHEVQPGNYGAGVAFQYGARNVWILCNEIYDNDAGVKVGSDGGGAGYIIGNLIYDCRYGGSYSTGSAWAPAAIMYWGGTDRYIANNTIYHCDGGIHSPASWGSMELVNNLIADLVPNRGRSIFLESGGLADQANLRNCGFDDTIRIQWAGGSYTSLKAFRGANPSREVGCRQAGELGFQGPSSNDFHLLSSSQAVDAGVLPGVYDKFYGLYGTDIRYDLSRLSRPRGAAQDIGAYERE